MAGYLKTLQVFCPMPSHPKPMLYLHAFPSPLGNILAAASEHGLCLLEFAGSQRIDGELRDLQRLLCCQTKQGENEHTRLV